MPRSEISDPQGQAVERSLPGIGLGSIGSVRIGKRITLSLDAPDEKAAAGLVEQACNKILANPVIEDFSFEIAASSNQAAPGAGSVPARGSGP